MVQIDLPIANGRYPMQIFAATRCSRYPMPDAALKQTKQTKLCFKNGHCFNRRSNCQKLKKMVQKMAPMPDADTRCSSRYPMPLPDANSGRYPMPDTRCRLS